MARRTAQTGIGGPSPRSVLQGTFREDMSYDERPFHFSYASQNDEAYFMEFRILHRLNLVQIQNELARYKASAWKGMAASESEMKDLRSLLGDYASAIRDYQFLRSLPGINHSNTKHQRADLSQYFPDIAELSGDPYNSRYCSLANRGEVSTDPLREFLKRILPRPLTYTKAEMSRNIDAYLAGLPPETTSPFVDKLARFLLAISAGAALVVPMLIMTFNKSNVKSTVTVSVAVLLFATTISLGVRVSNIDTLIATATYAAVLVVFIGTNGS